MESIGEEISTVKSYSPTFCPMDHRDDNSNIKYSSSIPVCTAAEPITGSQIKRKWKTIRRALSFFDLKHRQRWVQLAGHEDCFAVGDEGTILKKLQSYEKEALSLLMQDPLKPYIPQYNGIVRIDSHEYIEMQDLLYGFQSPSVMDCKMGVRTYLEDELLKQEKGAQARPDMYEKMIKVDAEEPTAEEHVAKAVTKPRYMQWRERISSSHTLGFRIEGIKASDAKPNVNFKHLSVESDIIKVLREFVKGNETILQLYITRLTDLREDLLKSPFYSSHELIGSSLLFVHDDKKANIWMIDFGKTRQLPSGVHITHTELWQRGNHEDGHLFGVTNALRLFQTLVK